MWLQGVPNHFVPLDCVFYNLLCVTDVCVRLNVVNLGFVEREAGLTINILYGRHVWLGNIYE